MTNLIPPNDRLERWILPSDRICKSTQQEHNQTQSSPALKAAANNLVALRYQENGHVTLPGSRAPGTIYVYGTSLASPLDKIHQIHKVWDASGDDREGRLIMKRSFDDGRCYQINNGGISKERQRLYPHKIDIVQGRDLWCEIDIRLPKTLATGSIYTLYWVWDRSWWPFSGEQQIEIYTTCIGIHID